MKLSQKLAKALAEKRGQVQALLAKGEAATEAELKQADDLIGEIATDDAAFKAAEAREKFAGENDEALANLTTVPVNGLPQQKDGGLAGFEGKDGELVISKKTREVLEENGFALSEKQFADISTKSYRDAFREYLKKGERGMGATDLKALAEGSDQAGGFLVPAEFLAKMVERSPADAVLASKVTNLTTSSDKLTMPKNNYSANDKYTTGVRVSWVDEEASGLQESNATDFGNITIPIHTAMLYHDVTKNLLEDSGFNIQGWLAGKFRETADLTLEDMIMNGDGIGKPAGILQNPGGANQPGVVVSGNAANITFDGIVDLEFSLLARYAKNADFIFNRTSTGRALAKLKDGNQRPLFNYGSGDNGMASARPSQLRGYNFIETDFAQDIAANAFPIVFGDLRGYYLARRVGFSIQVLNEIVATSNKVRLLGRMRIGGQVAEDWRLKIQKISA